MNTTAFNAAMLVTIAVFGFTAVFEASLLSQVSSANKAQQHALVCFDRSNRPVMTDELWHTVKECRTVAIRELKH